MNRYPSAVALTTDIWTDDCRKFSYLHVHAFWIPILRDRIPYLRQHLETLPPHCGGVRPIQRFEPVVTNRSNMVAGLLDSPRLDCMSPSTHCLQQFILGDPESIPEV